MEYYLAVNNTPKGPYTVDELKALSVRPDDLVWAKGMESWAKASEIDELREQLFTRSKFTPPPFDSRRFAEYNRPASSYETRSFEETEQCPHNFMWLSIISFIGIIPLAIVAVIKSSMVKRLWSEGNYEGARKQSRSAMIFALLSLIIGVPLTIFYYTNNPFTGIL